jgi:2-polyprenyl-6-methoxyphenol hydroxylase-like FAD-dependent oxidoreductase
VPTAEPGTPEPILVVGAGVAGLGTALALSRSGHRVTLVERDATPLPADPDAAFEWDRRGAPQVRHSHALLARLRNLLRDRYPDVLEALLAAGATEMRFADDLPVEITDRDPLPGDDDLVALACRRTTFEWVLRRTVLATDGVTLRHGAVVEGLVADGSGLVADGSSPVPRVVGALVRPGDAPHATPDQVDSPLVVAALGRRSAVPRWLGDLGVEPDAHEEDTGLIYLSRFYRLHADVTPPPAEGPIGGDLGYLKYAIFQGDNRTLSVTFALDAQDAELRARLIDPDGFDRAAGALEVTRPWVDPDLTAAITGVHTMGGLINRRVAYLDDDGRPLVLGFHAVGDAHTCTNPLYGRGCSLAMVQATLLADALADHPGDDPASQRDRAVAYEVASQREILPWYRAAMNQDRLNRQAAQERAAARSDEAGRVDGEPVGDVPLGGEPVDEAPHPDDARGDEPVDQGEHLDDPQRDEPVDGPVDEPVDEGERQAAREARDFMASLMRDGLMVAVRTDATVFRAFVRSFNLLDPPEVIMTDPDVVGRVLTAYQTRDQRPPEPPLGPDRAGLLDQLVD